MPKTRRTCSTKVVPYAKGFRPRSSKQSLQAIGYERTPPREFQPAVDFFPPISEPTSIDDWLAQYNESGQTYKQFLNECPWLSRRKWKYTKQRFVPGGSTISQKYPEGVICIQPIGSFDDAAAPSFDDLAEYVRLFFCLPVEVLPPVLLECRENGDIFWVPKQNSRDLVKLGTRHHRESGRTQLTVHSLLTQLKKTIPDNALCLMGFTMFDLFDSKTDLFVAGMASGNSRVGVFSFYRYDPSLKFSSEFWYDVGQAADGDKATFRMVNKALILQRCCKLMVHEISHLLGVDHCVWFACCMNGSGHISEDFRQPMFLCPVDLRKLQTLCGFDILSRYQGLLTFFTKRGMTEEVAWLQRRIDFISAKPDP